MRNIGRSSFAPDIGCLSYNAGNISVAHNTETILTMDSESYDTAGIHSTSVNTGRHTVPDGQGGKWLVVARAFGPSSATGETVLYIYKNSTLVARAEFANSTAINTQPQAIYLGSAIAGDYFELKCYQNTGGAANFNGWTTSPQVGISMASQRIA